MYCVKCKRNTDTLNLHHAVSKNNRNMLKGTCSVCGTTKNRFSAGAPGFEESVSAKKGGTTEGVTTGGDLTNSINIFTSKLKLPWAKFQA